MYVHLQRQRDPSMRVHTEVTVQVTLTPHRASSLTKLFSASVRKTYDGQDNNRNHVTVRIAVSIQLSSPHKNQEEHSIMRHNSLTIMTMFIFSSLLLHAQVAPPASAPASLQTKSNSSAISPEKAAKIDEMLTVTGTRPALLKILAQGQLSLRMYATREIVVPGVASEKVTTISAEEKKLTDDYLARMNKIADTEFGWNKLQPALLRYCADNFNQRANRQHHCLL
jgi:hypothetical protein